MKKLEFVLSCIGAAFVLLLLLFSMLEVFLRLALFVIRVRHPRDEVTDAHAEKPNPL